MQQGHALKALNIIYKALMAGQILFASVCIYLIYSKLVLPAADELDKVLQVAALIITAGGIFTGMSLFKKKTAEAGVVGYDGKLDIRPPYQREFIYKELSQNFPTQISLF